ncbi:MAG: glycine zipper 2TM domain-containing protein [Thiolinea sp.]
MIIRTTTTLLLLGTTLLGVTACSNAPTSSDVYSTASTGVLQEVKFGEVLGVRNIIIEQNSTETGQAAGGIIGAVAGSEVGKGKGRIVGGVVGAVAGSAIGSVVDRNVQARPGVELTLRMDSGRTVAIVQLAGEVFQPGERVKVLTDRNGRARVTH